MNIGLLLQNTQSTILVPLEASSAVKTGSQNSHGLCQPTGGAREGPVLALCSVTN